MLEAGDYKAAVSRIRMIHPLCARVVGADSAAALDAQVLLVSHCAAPGWPAKRSSRSARHCLG